MKFENAKELYEYLVYIDALYNKHTGQYIFDYNDAHALCVYSLTQDEMLDAARLAISQGVNIISAVLGVGGDIYDDSKYDHYRYSEKMKKGSCILLHQLNYAKIWFATMSVLTLYQ